MGKKLPLISVLVPSFNQGQFLRQTLASIFDQGYPHLEVVVMDGGSSDDSVAIIQTYADRLTHWQSQPDGGQGAAINAGMQYCSGDLVAWLNSDDWYYGQCLWTVAHAYEQLPDRGLYIGNGLRYRQQTGQYLPFCKQQMAFSREALAFGLDYILQPSVFFSRQAWERVGGLNPRLQFCMDWDILLRISNTYAVALIDDMLAVSREYPATKTSSGKLNRAYEIAAMVAEHTGQELTPGAAHYLIETLLDITTNGNLDFLSHSLYRAMADVHHHFAAQYGSKDGFPQNSDPQDASYLPLAQEPAWGIGQQRLSEAHLPQISLVVPSFNQAQFLEQTLKSIFNQGYPSLEVLVMDGGSTDGSVEIIQAYQEKLIYWQSQPDNGPANAINQGFARAQGDLVGWLSSDDLLAQGALWAAVDAFLTDPSLDLVYGNAFYVDEHTQAFLADHGTHRTSLYYGQFQPLAKIPLYWSYIHAVPQPTVLFRRSLLSRVGNLDEQYSFIFDFELFYRMAQVAQIQKLERVQAFYRIHTSSKTSRWSAFLVELYRFSRPHWPAIALPEFRTTLKSFLKYYLKANYGHYRRHDPRFLLVALVIGLSAVTGVGNPEALEDWIVRYKQRKSSASLQSSVTPPAPALPSLPLPKVTYAIPTAAVRYRSLFCSFFLPLHPGYSGGEIRDFHILRHLLSVSQVSFLGWQENPYQDRADILKTHLSQYLTLEAVPSEPAPPAPQVKRRYHHDVEHLLPRSQGLAPLVQQALAETQPDFLFVSPQVNPILLSVTTADPNLRAIMASYDVELVRVQRMTQGQRQWVKPKSLVRAYREPRRAARFERDNLAHYDGIIAVSELDKSIFVAEYGFEPERVLVVNNSVDTQYFGFTDRWPTDQPNITFVGSLTYPPNRQAALRLIQTIMPLVRQQQPDARLWIVGQGPGEELLSFSNGKQVVVTGKVEDVRPYLAQSVAMAAPLSSGSGTKYKILEALSAGVPVVCSSLALEGLNLTPDVHLLQADDAQAVAAALLQLMADPGLGADLAQQGRALIDREYAWDMSLQGIGPWLDAIARLPKRTAR